MGLCPKKVTQHLAATVDKRVQRTRRALFNSFGDRVLAEDSDAIQVTDIIQRAGVTRSTFFQHFASKDRILVDSMDGMLNVIADHICGYHDSEKMTCVLEHFWENRRLARAVLSGQPYERILRALAHRVTFRRTPETSENIPVSLHSTRKAAGTLAVIREWLLGNGRCSAAQLADFLGQGEE